MHLIKAIWRGDVPLMKTYWLNGFIASILTGMAVYNFPKLALSSLSATVYVVLVFLYLFVIIYSVFTCVAIWRSASKYEGNELWAWVAKFAVVCLVLMWIGWINLVFLVGYILTR
jgi:hypothetical protein